MFFISSWENKAISTINCDIAINNLNASIMNGFRVPIPPLEVQREIVKVLDTLTQLEAELEAELEARRRQYQYYRDALLSFDDDATGEGLAPGSVRWATLGNIGKVSMCKRVFKHETDSVGDIPFYKIGTFGGMPDAFISRELYHEYRRRYSFPKQGDILISAAGTIGRAIPYDGADAYFQDSNIVWIDNDESQVTNKYLWHWYQIVEWATDGGTIQRLYNENLRQTRIAIPPLEEQARIVAILDQFDALVNDLSSGLPAEIKARRQQYEYYRDRLLSFKEAA
ncbi:MAG: restriction endonuclease subunit S [Nitrosomonas sp.]|nr:restriction endonuclease subunit S [Nitrosomonas sp.]